MMYRFFITSLLMVAVLWWCSACNSKGGANTATDGGTDADSNSDLLETDSAHDTGTTGDTLLTSTDSATTGDGTDSLGDGTDSLGDGTDSLEDGGLPETATDSDSAEDGGLPETATDSDSAEDGGASEIPTDFNFTPAEARSGIDLRFDSLVYASGQSVGITLDMGPFTIPGDAIDIPLGATSSEDVEMVTLVRVSGNVFELAEPLTAVSSTAGTPLNGSMEVAPGEMFHAFYYIDKSIAALAEVPEDMVTDWGLMERTPSASVLDTVDPVVALSDDEANPPAGARPVGTFVTRGGQPVQIATHELIVYTSSDEETQRFLTLSSGTLKASQAVASDDGLTWQAHLVAIDPTQANPEHFPLLRELFQESGDFLTSHADVLGILTLALTYQLEGFPVSVNPRLQAQGAPTITQTETDAVTHTMELTTPPNVSGDCMPGDEERPCVENVPAVWAFTSLWDADERRINAAVLDMGFAPNDDFRNPSMGEMVQCDMTTDHEPLCEAGAAEGSPTVGNSFFGDRSWHGTGVVSTLSGIVNNDFGAAGVAGQVAVPMLYKYDTAAYVFEIGTGINLAVEHGASVINISGGYPCRILTNVGPDFDICSAEGRAGICGIVTASAAGAAALICAIPIVNIACGPAWAFVVAASATCMSTLAFGNLRSPMASAVAHAADLGVPVVTIAGNAIDPSSLPSILSDFVDLGDHRTESWGIIPAMIPETVVVGAVDENLDNVHYFGDRVDLWAPISSTYYAPEDTADPASAIVDHTIGGTSAAAPYVAGVIADMQAVNPDLDPHGTGSADRPNLVDRIKTILTAEANSFSNDELVALGYSNEPDERRRLVNPLAAVQAAAEGVIPDLDALGYDTSINYSELLGTDDEASDARPIDFETWQTGTILAIRGENGVSPDRDEDWYEVTLSSTLDRVVESIVTLRHPRGYGEVYLSDGPQNCAMTYTDTEVERTCLIAGYPGDDVAFSVVTQETIDNVYRFIVGAPEPARPTVEITQPTNGATVCADTLISVQAGLGYTWFPDLTEPSSVLYWSVDGDELAIGYDPNISFQEGTHELTAMAFDESASSDSINVTAIACVGEPPEADIISPSGDLLSPGVYLEGFDEVVGLWYADLTLEGEATDEEDGSLTGSALVWWTDQTDLQDAVLGTGESLTVRLYAEDCGGATHTISLIATDSDGNPSAPVTFQVFIWTMC